MAREAALRPIRLEFCRVSRRFARRRDAGRGGQGPGEAVLAVDDVSLTVADGEVVSLIGPSGCGKSTLLNIAAGLSPPSAGEVFVDSERVTGPNAHVAFMLQKDLLLPWRNIRENVEFGLQIQGVPAAERHAKSSAWLRRCRLADFAGHYPHQLSGGMRQRAALARTLAVDPRVLLLDEPFSALDAQTRIVLQRDLAATLADAGKTALFITHDLLEAITLSDRILVMSQRPGRIVEEISVDLPDRNDPVARRRRQEVGPMVARLMSLLHVGGVELEPTAA